MKPTVAYHQNIMFIVPDLRDVLNTFTGIIKISMWLIMRKVVYNFMG